MNYYLLGIVLGLVFVGCPIIGKKLFSIESKYLKILFFGTIILITSLIGVYSQHTTMGELGSYYTTFFTMLFRFENNYDLLFMLILLSYIFGAIGLVEGIFENIELKKQNSEIFSQRKSPSKSFKYSYFLIYGYIFLFAIFSFAQFLMLALKWTYLPHLNFIPQFMSYMFFDNVLLVIIGGVFYGSKTFKYGLHSLKTDKIASDPSLTNISKFRVGYRHYIGCILGTIIVFCALMVFFIELSPNPSFQAVFNIPQSIFFLTASLQSFMIYFDKEKFVKDIKDHREKLEKGVVKEVSSDMDNIFEEIEIGIEDESILETYIGSDLQFDD